MKDLPPFESFFKLASSYLPCEVHVALTGAVAGALMGQIRPSLDIDFAIEPSGKDTSNTTWEAIEQAIQRTVKETGIPANYGLDIDRWGMITLLDYRKHLRYHKTVGKVHIHYLSPEYWAIGKLGRFLDVDVADLIVVLSKARPNPKKAAGLWGKALRQSPPSSAKIEFRRHVEYLFREHGKKVWGNSFDENTALRTFQSQYSPDNTKKL